MFWPMILSTDIFLYLMFYPSELKSADLSEYKTCKAYGYYRDGWLMPQQYHSMSSDSPYCIITRESSKVSGSPHRLWVLIEKQNGRILRGHCSCMAGMGQTCNHVATGLFRIEVMLRLGLTNPSYTSKPDK